MFKNFFKTAWRHIKVNPVVAIIQVVGLTVGFTVLMLIMLWVNNQISFDRFNEHADRIYRLEMYSNDQDGATGFQLAAGPEFKYNTSGIVKFVRIRPWGWESSFSVPQPNGADPKVVNAGINLWADSSFFSVFSFDFIYGDPASALQTKNGIVITESLSKKCFGNDYPIGQEVINTLSKTNQHLVVTGVIKDVNNFHIPFQGAIFSFLHMKDYYENTLQVKFRWDSWESWGMHPTYFLLHKNVSPGEVSRQMKEYATTLMQSRDPNWNYNFEFKLRPLKKIYFSSVGDGIHGNIRLIAGLTSIALLILLIACVNFINLNTTRTFKRSKEVGIKKMAGSSRSGIFGLFSGEVLVLCFISLAFSVFFVYLLVPYFNSLVSSSLTFSEIYNKYNLLTTFGCFLIIFVFAGIIPSWFISNFLPVSAIRSLNFGSSKKNKTRQKIFLGIQYGITIIVIAVTVIVGKQMHYMKTSDLGFNPNNVLVSYYPSNGPEYKNESTKKLFKEKIMQHPDVVNAAYCWDEPPNSVSSFATLKFNDKVNHLERVRLDPGYFDVLEIPIIKGRDFIEGNKADQMNSENKIRRVLLNEKAIEAYGIENPVGYIGTWGSTGSYPIEIIGVVKNYHHASMKSEIPPIVYTYIPNFYQRLLIKTKTDNYQDVIKYIEKVKVELFGGGTAAILSNIYNQQYKSEEQLSKLFIWFSMLSVLIAALGLYGISSNAIQRRIKEIGIRKVNGATSGNVITLVESYFTKIVLGAGIIAIPVSWYLSTRWLLSYPYKTNLSWWVFAGTLAFALLIAILTISWRTWNAANQNPVNALRYE